MAFQRSIFRTWLVVSPVIAAIACSEPGASETTGQGSDAKALYDKNCTLCHGRDGKLMLAGAPDLTLSTLSREERVDIILNGKGNMTPFKGKLSDEQVGAIADYLNEMAR